MILPRTTTVSAPGKVLLTGGYLVLDRENTGLVVAADSRFYVTIRNSETISPQPLITVRSPQFLDGLWKYRVDVENPDDPAVLPIEDEARNGYVQVTLHHTIRVAAGLSKSWRERLGTGLEIIILGSNDFYSQREQLRQRSQPINVSSLSSLPQFCPTLSKMQNVHKTGLGSSAAMITSLVGALLTHLGAITLPLGVKPTESEPSDLRLAHNCAQLCHCLAQGKIGSGFDVSAAVFGTHVYRRFSPKVLDAVLSENQRPPSVQELNQIVRPETGGWDSAVEPLEVPPGFNLVLADIDAGSSTPKLVSKVIAWRKAQPDAAAILWASLNDANIEVERLLRRLSELAKCDPSNYRSTIAALKDHKAERWKDAKVDPATFPFRNTFVQLYESFQVVRSFLRELSERADVPVEPPEQTRLLDACTSVPGVIAAGVPGAGGYDAIFCLVLSDTARENVQSKWNSWTELDVGPLLTKQSSAGLYRIEALNIIPGLESIIDGIPGSVVRQIEER
ncbi:Phosphomevalonate kinase [Phlyctochytrium arcticum]|nr:Phosphomevalonate kinase [Phlyctochytrium arcticum]